eukprot:4651887-Prymnesium_polylepis.1
MALSLTAQPRPSRTASSDRMMRASKTASDREQHTKMALSVFDTSWFRFNPNSKPLRPDPLLSDPLRFPL